MAKKELGSLESVLEGINKSQGAGSVYELGSFKPLPIDRLPSGSLSVDFVLGGGYPIGRIIELSGWESSGKSTLALLAVANAQKAFPDKRALYIDGEHALDLTYAEALGVDVKSLILSQPDNMENGYQTIEALVRTGQISIVVFDSVAGTITQKELEGEIGETTAMGVKAKLMSQAMPKFAAMFSNSKTTGIWINQFREKLGVMFGSPITTPGGNALKFTASVRLEVKQGAKEKDSEGVIDAIKVRIKCIKNKTSIPFREREYSIIFGQGIDIYGEIIDFAEELEIIKKSGSWFSYGDTKLGQGRAGVSKLLADNPELAEELTAKIYKGLEEQ